MFVLQTVHRKRKGTLLIRVLTEKEYLEEHMTCEAATYKACMSVRSFYNYFWALTGYTYKEYLRKRRLAMALTLLRETEDHIIDTAIRLQFGSHESFTRAFKHEYGITPSEYRKCRQPILGLSAIQVIKEMYMGIIVKELPEMRVVSFTGFSPDPETKAHTRIWDWQKKNGGLDKKPFRNFGHNTDHNGDGCSAKGNFDNYGYKVMVTIPEEIQEANDDLTIEAIKPGRFIVTGVEGDVQKGGKFISEGWKKIWDMAKTKGYKVKSNGRCYEEKLEPSVPGLLRLDLYMEIE